MIEQFTLKKKKSEYIFILTWSAFLDLAAVPDGFSHLPVFLDKQIPPTCQYLKNTLKIFFKEEKCSQHPYSCIEATLPTG